MHQPCVIAYQDARLIVIDTTNDPLCSLERRGPRQLLESIHELRAIRRCAQVSTRAGIANDIGFDPSGVNN